MLTVLVPAAVDLIVAVACPEAFVVEPGCAKVFPDPVAAIVVVAPTTGLLFASRRVIVRVEVVVPSAVTPLEGDAERVEFATTAEPATKVTLPVTDVRLAGVAMLRVFACATVEAIVPVATPDALVIAPG